MKTQLVSISHWGMHEVQVTSATKAFIEQESFRMNLINKPKDAELLWAVEIELDGMFPRAFKTLEEANQAVQSWFYEQRENYGEEIPEATLIFSQFYYNHHEDAMDDAHIVVKEFEAEIVNDDYEDEVTL